MVFDFELFASSLAEDIVQLRLSDLCMVVFDTEITGLSIKSDDIVQPVLDTVLLSAVVFGTTAEHSLDALCDRLSITIPAGDRHTAMGDARATAEAVVKLLPLLQGRGIRCLAELLTETRRHGRLLQDLNPTP